MSGPALDKSVVGWPQSQGLCYLSVFVLFKGQVSGRKGEQARAAMGVLVVGMFEAGQSRQGRVCVCVCVCVIGLSHSGINHLCC